MRRHFVAHHLGHLQFDVAFDLVLFEDAALEQELVVGRERVQANPNEQDPGGVRITINPPKKAAAVPGPDGGP